MQFQASGREQARGGTGSGTSIILQYWRSGQEGGGTARLWRRMAAPTGGPKGLPDGVGTWLSAFPAQGGDAGVEGTCNVDWQFQCGVEMRPAALFDDNGAETETHVDGFLEAAWNALTAFLKAMWEAIKELASAVVDWIWEFLESTINAVTKPILDLYEDFKEHVKNAYNQNFISGSSSKSRALVNINTISENFLFNILTHPFVLLLSMLSTAAFVFLTIGGAFVKFFSGGSDTIVQPVVDAIIRIFTKIATSGTERHATALTATILMGFIYETIPKDSDRWDLIENGWGIAEVAIPLSIVAVAYLKNIDIGLDVDGLKLTIIGFLLSKIIPGIIGSLIGVILGGIGWLYTLINWDPGDEVVTGWWEELLAGISFIFGVAQLVRAFEERLPTAPEGDVN